MGNLTADPQPRPLPTWGRGGDGRDGCALPREWRWARRTGASGGDIWGQKMREVQCA